MRPEGRENQRWGNIGNHAEHIAGMKTWVQARISWLNANLDNYQACANPEVPNKFIPILRMNKVFQKTILISSK